MLYCVKMSRHKQMYERSGLWIYLIYLLLLFVTQEEYVCPSRTQNSLLLCSLMLLHEHFLFGEQVILWLNAWVDYNLFDSIIFKPFNDQFNYVMLYAFGHLYKLFTHSIKSF
jgi:hypothetical protein